MHIVGKASFRTRRLRYTGALTAVPFITLDDPGAKRENGYSRCNEPPGVTPGALFLTLQETT
jgi:hypothetical protein